MMSNVNFDAAVDFINARNNAHGSEQARMSEVMASTISWSTQDLASGLRSKDPIVAAAAKTELQIRQMLSM